MILRGHALAVMSGSFKGIIKTAGYFRRSAYASTALLSLLVLAILCPIYLVPDVSEATTGTATESTLAFAFVDNKNTASVSLNVTDADGSFATSTSEELAEFSLSTNNATGYTLNLRTSGSETTLAQGANSISAINGSKLSSEFAVNTWGLLPSKYNSTSNTTNYYSASNAGFTMDVTSAANTTANTYTVGLGIKADFTIPTGTYTNSTIIAEYVANPVNYSITYNKGNISGTPSNIPSVQSGNTSATNITLSSSVPVFAGYTFIGWCFGTVTTTNDTDSCTGTIYNPNGDGTNLAFGIDQINGGNVATIYAMWSKNPYMWGATIADCGKTMWDNRDGAERLYTTASITAGGETHCWMTTNLNLGGNTSLYSSTSNVPSGYDNTPYYTLPTSSTNGFSDNNTAYIYNSNNSTCNGTDPCYSYYSYMAVSAGTGDTSFTFGNITYDICPKGWRLPTDSEFSHLISGYTVGDELINSGFRATVAGYYVHGAPTGIGSIGYYWSSTVDSGGLGAKNLGFGIGGGVGVNSYSKLHGFEVRCVYDGLSSHNLTVNFAGSGVSSVQVRTAAGTGGTLIGTISSSGGSIAGLNYHDTYYLYPVFAAGYEFNGWANSGSFGTLSATNTSNPTFTMGAGDSIVAITGKAKTYTVNITNSNTSSGSSSISVPYGGSATVTVTPSSNYYLSSVSCPSGYTCTGFGTGSNYTGQQTVTVINNNTTSGGTLAFSGTLSKIYMWNATSANCGATMYDDRDGVDRAYTTAIINGQCWMTSNLELAGGTTLNSSTSNVASSYTLPASSKAKYTFSSSSTAYVYNSGTTSCSYSTGCSSYYSHVAACAGNSPSNNGENCSYDICPKGWRLPTSTETSPLFGYNNQYINYFIGILGSFISYNDDYNTTEFYSSSMNSGAYYYTSTVVSSASADFLSASTYNGPNFGRGNYGKQCGFYIRCVAKS